MKKQKEEGRHPFLATLLDGSDASWESIEPRILVCGFERFGPYPENSTQLLAESIEGKQIGEHKIFTMIFPPTIPEEDRGMAAFEKARAIDALGIVCLGMGSEKPGLCIETATFNRIDNATYCPPELNGSSIRTDRPRHEGLSLDINRWNIQAFRKKAAQEGITTALSIDPGGYCCNHLMYQMRLAQEFHMNRDTPWIYIHVPCSPECIPKPLGGFKKKGKVFLPIKTLERGLALLLENASL
ncbi:MAG: pcp [Candidatus Taylorbacteria bacterium]|nr:pcp [Candidatus Taylorbacteria bacterium]